MKENKELLPSDKKHKRIILKKNKISFKYGKKPGERKVEELLSSCMINLDKPKGPTSHQVDSWVKKILKTDKVGHSGTLDPNATGVLPLGIGNATKVLQYLLPAGKEYIALVKLHKDCDKTKIKEVCKSYVGKIRQTPPVRSAVKRVKRSRAIYYLNILDIKDRDILLKVGCESGTYIRTLATSIGKKLKTGAHLADLRRSRVGHIKEENSIYLQDLKDAIVFYRKDKDERFLKNILKPVEYMLNYLPKIVIADSAVDAICHGANLMIPGIVELDSDIKRHDLVLLETFKGEAVAVAKTVFSTEDIIQKEKGECARLEKVIMKTGVYPSIWKKP